jgi:hypothetical protein
MLGSMWQDIYISTKIYFYNGESYETNHGPLVFNPKIRVEEDLLETNMRLA